MNSPADFDAAQQLETATQIADRCDPNRVPADPVMAQARALIGIGQAVRALTEELRESRAELANALANYPRWSQPVQLTHSGSPDPVPTETARTERGQTGLALLLLAGVIVLLTVLCVVLALT